jgi:deoxycytidylate deaminase
MMKDRPFNGKDVKILNILSKVAEAVPPVRSARIASAIVIKGNIVSFGVNKMKTHPFQAKYSRNAQAIYVHSENDAIMRAIKRVGRKELSNATLYVARVKHPNNMWGMACPCEGCMKAINEFNIKTVIHTTDSGDFVKL